MNQIQRTRKTKIELTQRSTQKYISHYQNSTPPKFRTNQSNYVHTEVSSRQSSRYQTLEHKPRPAMLPIPQLSRDSSVKKNPKNLHIDTDSINKHYEIKQDQNGKKQPGVTPLFANEDSVTILHRLQNKRKSEGKVSYDNLIEAIKLSYKKEEQEPQVINLSDDYFQISQSKAQDSHGMKSISTSQPLHISIIRSMYRQIEQLRREIGDNPKLFQINMLLSQVQQQASNSRCVKTQTKLKCSQLQSNQIQNSLIIKQYVHNLPERWFTKQKQHNPPKKEKENENHRVRTMIDEKEKQRQIRQKEREKEREKARTSFKTKSPLRDIINYVNKKR